MNGASRGGNRDDLGLDDAFRYADATRNKIEWAKKQARKNPVEIADGILEGIPAIMRRLRNEATTKYGVDIAAPEEALRTFKVHDFARASGFLHRLNTYSVYKEAQDKLQKYTSDPALTSGQLAAKVCEVGIEAANALDELWLHMLNEQRRYTAAGGSTQAAKIASREEGRRMAAHLATRTSLRKNRSLAKALDEIRGYDGPRGRLDALLRELYVEGPQAWDAQRGASRPLLSTRNAAAKKIVEQSRGETPREDELFTFAEREALLKHARSAGLTPREHELFRLVVSDQKRFLRNKKLNHSEAAKEMGVAVGTINSLWSRARKTLQAS